MKPLEEIYKKSFFGRRYKLNWRAPIICLAIECTLQLSKFDRIIDLGCATGDLVAEWKNRGYYLPIGVEGSENAMAFLEKGCHVVHADLRKELSESLSNFDLVTSFEVLEHIEEEYVEVLVDNICGLTSRYIVVSAAPPGQGGHYHVNCKDQQYWISKFEKRPFTYDEKRTREIQALLDPWKSKPGIKAIHQNLMTFYGYGVE